MSEDATSYKKIKEFPEIQVSIPIFAFVSLVSDEIYVPSNEFF